MTAGSIKARIRCVLEVPVGTWTGGKVDLDQLADQVRREGIQIVNATVGHAGGKVVGTPEVMFMVLLEGKHTDESAGRL